MPKKLKLNLNDLKIQSFVTTLKSSEEEILKGGADTGTNGESCTCNTNCTCYTCGTCGTWCNTCRPSICSGYVCC